MPNKYNAPRRHHIPKMKYQELLAKFPGPGERVGIRGILML